MQNVPEDKPLLILDPEHLFSYINEAQRDLDIDLDESELVSFIFENIKLRDKAMENIDYALLDLASKRFSLGFFGTHRECTEDILKMIKKLTKYLMEELDTFGCYDNNNLVYHPNTDINSLHPYKVVFYPFILVPENAKRTSL